MGSEISVRTLGTGPAVLLVHGGLGPSFTWRAQKPLAERWRLVVPSRRGYPPSPPSERQDYLVDADDLDRLLDDIGPAHAVGFSYGSTGLLLAALRDLSRLRSLTLIEPPLFGVARGNPDVERLVEISLAYRDGQDPAVANTRTFEALAGISDGATTELATEMERVRRLARGMRVPIDLVPDLAAVREAGIPSLVVSGGHDPGLEAMCDALAEGLGGRRETLTGAGHAAQRAPGFNEVLEGFLADAGQAEPAPPQELR